MLRNFDPAKLALQVCLGAAALSAATFRPAQIVFGQNGSALAQGAGAAEKDAFNAAKELGTVEAWDAFLSNYSNGFHADLARAYVKQLAEQAAAVAVKPSADEFPVEAGSWGGIVRSGPGQSYAKQDSLAEGDTLALMGVSPDLDNGYPWFKIWYGPDQKKGYMWGGILCAKGAERPDVYKTCMTAPPARPNAVENQGGGNGGSDFCARPANDAERAVCANSKLSSLDAQLNAEYSLAVTNITSEAVGGTQADVARFRGEQKAWLSRRNDCGDDISCLASAYRARLKVLKEQNQPE